MTVSASAAFISCIPAVWFFGILMNAPKKSIPASALTAAAVYLLWEKCAAWSGLELTSYFIASAVGAMAGELYARKMKIPATVFIFPIILPLVPGVGIYRTMLALVHYDYDKFQRIGAETIISAGAIAIAVALVNILVRNLFPKAK